MTETLGAEKHERADERIGYRNGYRSRQLYIPEFDQNACFDLLIFAEVLPKIFRNRASYSSRFSKAPRQKSNR